MTRHLPPFAVPAAVAAGALLILAACAGPDAAGGSGPDAGTDPDLVSDPGTDGQRYQTVATVLESPDHGPQLCFAVQDSYPPQCGGPDIVGWDWGAVESEAASGTTWGSYTLVGTWDGERFTLAEPARPADPAAAPARAAPDFSTPCPEPEGGWQPADPATATAAALDEALSMAATAPDYAGGWVDQPGQDSDPAQEDQEDQAQEDQAQEDRAPEDRALEDQANDPDRLVLNLRFTGDLAQREEWIRDVWGGALCVSEAEHTEAELREIQQQLHEDLPEVQSAGVDVVANAVTIEVLVATPQLQQELDDRYGEGTVVLHGQLQPVD